MCSMLMREWADYRLLFTRIIAILALLGVLGSGSGGTATPVVRAAAGDWTMYMGDLSHSGYNEAETIINPSSASSLQLQWTQTSGGNITAQPIVANGLIYWGSWDGYERATSLNGSLVWATYVGVSPTTCVPGVGVADTATVATVSINGQMIPVVFVGGGNVELYALNANTGAVIWQTPLGSPPAAFLWGPPTVYNGSVYIGVSSLGDCPVVQGQLVQVNASTGAIQHTFNVVPNGCIGGGVWDAPTVDTSAGTIYIGTGNTNSCSTPETQAAALIELNAADLSLVHSWQIPLTTRWWFDSDFGSTPVLFTATIGGTLHNLVGLINKNGIYYVFDRANISNGPLWQVQLGLPANAINPPQVVSSAWDGSTLYMATANATVNGTSCLGTLEALNPANGAIIWRDCLSQGPVLGAMMAVPGLVAVGAGDTLLVVDATSGNTLFSYQDPNGQTFDGSVTIANGVLYIGDTGGTLFAFAPASTNRVAQPVGSPAAHFVPPVHGPLPRSAAAAKGTGQVTRLHLNVPGTGTHFLYVDNGLSPNNKISGYQITSNGLVPTPGSPYSTGGLQGVAAFGANQIATSTVNGPCVFHTDATSGLVESFAVNSSTGALTEVSIITVGDGSTYFPGDIHVSADGKYLYLAAWGTPSYLDVLTIGSGCSLTLASSLAVPNKLYFSIALVSSSQLMAIDNQNGRIDIYSISGGTTLKLLSSNPSQLTSPDGAGAAIIGTRTYIFNGIGTSGTGGVEVHTINAQGALGSVPGSPQMDPSSYDGAHVFFDRSHDQVIASEQYSNTLGIYGARGHAFAFLGQGALPAGRGIPTAMTELGSTLYVVTIFGSVDACTVGSGSLSCSLAATLLPYTMANGIGAL
jgi:polyvinyl alcohol dehydrogenase (cytochrome)